MVQIKRTNGIGNGFMQSLYLQASFCPIGFKMITKVMERSKAMAKE